MKKINKYLVFSTLLGLLIMPALTFAQVQKTEKGAKPEVLNSFDIHHGEEQVISLDSFTKKKMVVMVFTSSHCSYAIQYQERLNKLYQNYKDKDVVFIAVNSNDPTLSGRESASRMTEISDFEFPYVKDQDQSIARKLNASINPEAVILVPKEGKFKIGYRGKIDDNPLSESMVKNHFLKGAIDKLLAGEKPESMETEPTGCDITWIE